MPKDRRVSTSSFDRAMVSPYSCSSKISDRMNPDIFSPHIGDEREWEEARCPICMENPHNAVLLLCSSRENGCRPFICDTSYRHSNCLDQFRKSSSSSFSPQGQQSQLVCPLCRGSINGWDAIHPARRFMNCKTRNCSLETCDFSGNYADLRKHARVDHPFERPAEASPTQQSMWTILEQLLEMEDALAHQPDIEYVWDRWLSWDEWGENGLWSNRSFSDMPLTPGLTSGPSPSPSVMSATEDELTDEIFRGTSYSPTSPGSFLEGASYSPTSPGSFFAVELMDSGSSRSTISGSRSNNQLENDNLACALNVWSRSRSSYHSENEATVSRSRSSYRWENGSTNVRSRSRLSYRRENGSTISNPTSHHRQNVPTSLRTRSSYHGRNGSVSRSRSSYHRGNVPATSQARSSYHGRNGSVSRSRSSYHRENVRASSRARSSYRGGYTQPSSRARSRSRYDRMEVGPSVRRSSRQSRSDFARRRENGSTISNPTSHHRQNVHTSLRTRSSYHGRNGSVSRSRSSYHCENDRASSRARSSYRGEYTQPGSRARSRYDCMEVGYPWNRPRSDFARREE